MARALKPRPPLRHAERVAPYLRAVRDLVEKGHWEQATSLAYYAAFHAALALLATAGIGAETHSGVQQALSLHFVKEGPLERGLGRLYSQLMTDRGLADYGFAGDIDEQAGRDAIRGSITLLRAFMPVLAERAPETTPVNAEIAAALDALVRALKKSAD
jgi:uncharacterized protein (UPF0332 family)